MNFGDLLSENRIEFRRHGEHHHVTPGWIGVDCPFCSPDSQHFRLGFNLENRYFICWKCGPHRIVETLSELLHKPPNECYQLLGELPKEKTDRVYKPRGVLKLPRGVGALQPPHRKYLRQRGFDPEELVRLWGLQGFGPIGKFAWRIFIPIMLGGQLVSWTTRSIGTSGKRYITAAPDEESVSPKTFLYGQDYCRHTIIVCEGPTDVWRIGPGAVCLFGNHASQSQIARMLRYPKRIVCLDNEPLAQKMARKLTTDLTCGDGETWNVVLDAKDPGSMDSHELSQLQTLLRTNYFK